MNFTLGWLGSCANNAHARSGLQARDMTHQSVSADKFVSLLKSLRAVRQFRDKPLPAEAVRDIHEVIRWSGSASNRQEFQVLWIEDRATLRRLADQTGYVKHLAGAAAGAVILTSRERAEPNPFAEGRTAARIMPAPHTFPILSTLRCFLDPRP